MSLVVARQSTTPTTYGRQALFKVCAQAISPRPAKTVSAWADSERVLSSKGSGESGRWNTKRTPYLREIMDALSERSPVQTVVLRFAAQLGKTEVGLNWIGYTMDEAPAPMLVVLPTLEVRKRWVKQRLNPMIEETKRLRSLFDTKISRDASNTEDIKDFAGGMLILGGANAPASLASMPIKKALYEEIDRFPWQIGNEGDPLSIVRQRQKSFPRRKELLISTPTVEGESRIDEEHEKTDQREYNVPCPHCERKQVLRWRHPDGTFGLVHEKATGRVFYRCKHCEGEIEEHHKTWMLEHGVWIPKYPERKARGYSLSGLYAPIGLGLSWAELWADWENAQHDSSKLRVFVNTNLGEAWKETGESIDEIAWATRLEEYAPGLMFGAVVAGVDVQKDRLEMSVVGFGAGEEAWVLDHIIIPGDTAEDDCWEELAITCSEMGVQTAAIDSAFNTSFVYQFCEKHRWAIAIRGVDGFGRPLIEDEVRRRQRRRRRMKFGFQVEPVGVDQGKSLVYARVKLPNQGPGYIHFPRRPAFDDEYFTQLGAEKLVAQLKAGRTIHRWVKTRPRNEALDCLIYAFAAARLSGRDLNKALYPNPFDGLELEHGPDGEALISAANQAVALQGPNSTPKPRTPQTSKPQRRISNDDWGSRL